LPRAIPSPSHPCCSTNYLPSVSQSLLGDCNSSSGRRVNRIPSARQRYRGRRFSSQGCYSPRNVPWDSPRDMLRGFDDRQVDQAVTNPWQKPLPGGPCGGLLASPPKAKSQQLRKIMNKIPALSTAVTKSSSPSPSPSPLWPWPRNMPATFLRFAPAQKLAPYFTDHRTCQLN
jgi:hypothetical protein